MSKAFRCDRCEELYEGESACTIPAESIIGYAKSQEPVEICNRCLDSHTQWYHQIRRERKTDN